MRNISVKLGMHARMYNAPNGFAIHPTQQQPQRQQQQKRIIRIVLIAVVLLIAYRFRSRIHEFWNSSRAWKDDNCYQSAKVCLTKNHLPKRPQKNHLPKRAQKKHLPKRAQKNPCNTHSLQMNSRRRTTFTNLKIWDGSALMSGETGTADTIA